MKFNKHGIVIIPININEFYNAPNIASFYESCMQTRMDLKWSLKNEIQ